MFVKNMNKKNLNFIHNPEWQKNIKKIYKKEGIDGCRVFTAIMLVADKKGRIRVSANEDIESMIFDYVNNNIDFIDNILTPILKIHE